MILRCCRPPRSEGRWAMRDGVDRHPDGPVLADRLVGDGRRGLDRDLGGRLFAPADLDPALEVEHDPGVGGLLQFELLDLDLAVPRGHPPVDPVHAVARRVGPHGRHEGRRLERPFRGGWLPSRLAAGSRQAGSGSSFG